ncbi:MAG: hypothetical protein HY209_06325 [Candidatus Omnitrophica bacterium]|nr:hypothetical protein [Candidatus Omnitrophota bacterium]
MWPQLRKTAQESGIVMVIVLLIVMVMMIFAVTILSQSMSQSKTSRSAVDQIVGDQLAKGLFWNSYASGSCFGSLTVPLNSRTYTATITNVLISPNISNCTINISY